MTESEAKGFVQGKLDCMKKCDVFNKEDKHRNNECELCEYCYSQGNFGQQKEAFEVSINALKKQIPKKPYVQQVFDKINNLQTVYDVAKVVEELESELKKGNIAIDFGEFRLFEIVKQGGARKET